MNCEQSRELFVDYLGEELSGAAFKELKDHLKLCSQCREDMASLVRTKSALRAGWPDQSIPQSLTFDLAAPKGQGFWSRFLPLRLPGIVWASLSVAGCFLVCLAGLTLSQAQIRLQDGNFSLSFGQPATPVALDLRKTSISETGPNLKSLLDDALKQLEMNQNAKLQQALQEAKLEWEAKRDADMAKIGREVKYLQDTQNVVWKETLLTNSSLEMLARNYVKATPPESLQ